jgi:NADH dehydrogenase FAD-containing subunit
MLYDLIVVGKGPAGLSAAIYAIRAGLSVLVIGRDAGALATADLIENYLGFPEPVHAAKLMADSEAQARRLGVEILTEEVTGLLFMENYGVQTTTRELEAKSLVIATGMPRKKATVPGLAEFEGRGVSYCAKVNVHYNISVVTYDRPKFAFGFTQNWNTTKLLHAVLHQGDCEGHNLNRNALAVFAEDCNFFLVVCDENVFS